MTDFATADLLVRHHQHALHQTADQHRLAREARQRPAPRSPAARPARASGPRHDARPATLPLRAHAGRLLVRAGLRLAPGQALLLVEAPQTATDPERWIARSSVPR
jgi:hypothetical protein